MEEACGLPHLTRLFPFGLCRYYMFFLIPIQQHGALKDFFEISKHINTPILFKVILSIHMTFTAINIRNRKPLFLSVLSSNLDRLSFIADDVAINK